MRANTLRRDRISRASREAIEVAAQHVAEDADELVAALASAHAVALWMRAGEVRARDSDLERLERRTTRELASMKKPAKRLKRKSR